MGEQAPPQNHLLLVAGGGPYTAVEEGNTIFTPGMVRRSKSKICRVESMLTFNPNSRFALMTFPELAFFY